MSPDYHVPVISTLILSQYNYSFFLTFKAQSSWCHSNFAGLRCKGGIFFFWWNSSGFFSHCNYFIFLTFLELPVTVNGLDIMLTCIQGQQQHHGQDKVHMIHREGRLHWEREVWFREPILKIRRSPIVSVSNFVLTLFICMYELIFESYYMYVLLQFRYSLLTNF